MDPFYIGDLKLTSKANFEELNSPKILYKYRDWKEEYHKQYLMIPNIYLSAPNKFEDKQDCGNQTRYDLLNDFQIFDIFYKKSKEINHNFDFDQHFSWALYRFQNTPLRDPLLFKLIESRKWDEFNDVFGVFCVTRDPYNAKMWQKYGAKNKGFCIGYDSEMLFNYVGGGCEVQYCVDFPKIIPFEDYMMQHFKQVFYKTTKWQFEKEYRLHKTWKETASVRDRNPIISKECIIEVLLGYKISEKDKFEIVDYVKKELPHVKIIEVNKDQMN